jgi:hypothetical protein
MLRQGIALKNHISENKRLIRNLEKENKIKQQVDRSDLGTCETKSGTV